MCARCRRASVLVCDLPAWRYACTVFVRCSIVVGGCACVCSPILVRRAHLRVYEVAARTPAPASPSRCGVALRWCGGMAAAAAASCCARGNVPSGLNNSRASASCAPAGTPACACLCVSPSRGGVSGRGHACDGGRAIDCVRAHPALTWNNRWRASCARVSTAPRVHSGGTPSSPEHTHTTRARSPPNFEVLCLVRVSLGLGVLVCAVVGAFIAGGGGGARGAPPARRGNEGVK